MQEKEIRYFLSLYTRIFPQKEHVHITTCTNISSGWEGDLFCLSLDYEEAREQRAEEVVLKLYYGQSGTQKAHREFRCLQQLAAVRYPVPRALFATLEDSPFGRAGVAMEKIQGHTVADVFDTLSREGQQELVTRCCQLYVDLHALDWEACVPHPERYQTKNVLRSLLTQARALSDQRLPHVFDAVIEWLQTKCGEVSCQRLSVIHGDFHLNNIVLSNDGALFVIDWTGVDVSDFRFDLAWTLLLLRTQGAVELARMVLGEYERLVGHRIEQLAFFEVIACFRRLFDIAVSLSSGATTLGMKPDAEEQMKKQIDHIQAVYAQLQERIVCPLPEIEKLMVSLGDPTPIGCATGS